MPFFSSGTEHLFTQRAIYVLPEPSGCRFLLRKVISRGKRERRGREMYLKRPIWSDGASATPENPSGSETGEDSDAAAMVVEELVTSLNTQRLYRELTLSLRTGLRDACAEFSFLRIRGLRSLLKTLRTVADSDSIIRLFSHTQTIPDLQRLIIFNFALSFPN